MPALEKFAFLMLLTSANHRTFGNARPAMRVLASTLGRSLSCTRNAVSALRYNGLIAPVGSNRGGFAPTLWQLHPERLGRPWQEPPVAHQTTGGPRLKTIGDPARFPKGGPRLKTSPDQRTYSAATFTSGVEGIVRRPRAHGQRGELGAIRGVVPSSPESKRTARRLESSGAARAAWLHARREGRNAGRLPGIAASVLRRRSTARAKRRPHRPHCWHE